MTNPTASETTELSSAHPFDATLERLVAALEEAGMTIFARIDHRANAERVGLSMPPTTVLIYGNPRGGTRLMLEAPALALDLPLRVLIRENEAGTTLVSFHAAVTLMRAVGLADAEAEGFAKSQALIAKVIAG